MLKSKQRTTDKRLSELVTKVRCTVRCLDQYLLRSLIEPLALLHALLPVTFLIVAGI